MKRLALIAGFVPGAALAHGQHAPVPEAAHGLAHAAGPALGIALVALALGFGWYVARRRD